MRTCAWCEGSLEGRRPHAVYCSRTCKTKASDQRRKEDGRAIARDRARYPREAEHRREYARRYLAENPDRMREIRRKRKAKTRGTGEGVYDFTDRDWARLVNRYGGRCAYCGEKAVLQRDHVVPLALGGTHGPGNITPACQPCNYSKGAVPLTVWRKRLRTSGRG